MTTRTSSLPHLSLIGHFAEKSDFRAAVRVAGVLFIVCCTAAAAQVSFPLPFTPVPFTIQPLVVLLGGAALGWRLGATAQIAYLLAGAAGLPIFAASPELPQGILRLAGPTGGYLLSYPLAAAITGALAERGMDRQWTAHLMSMLTGLLVVYAGGVVRLALGPPAPLGFPGALAAGGVAIFRIWSTNTLAILACRSGA